MSYSANNPFTLTFGTIPEQFISRPRLTDRIMDDFLADKPTSQTYMITGGRGSGKTVMLTEISMALREYDDWITIELNPEEELMDALASKLYNIEKIKPLFIKSRISLAVGGSGATIEQGSPAPTSEVIVEMMLKILAKHKKRLLISIDEVSNNRYVKKFAHSYQIFLRAEYPVYMYSPFQDHSYR